MNMALPWLYMRGLLPILLLAALSLHAAHAQQTQPRGAVSVYVSEGRLLRLDQNVTNVLVSSGMAGAILSRV